MLLPKTYDPIAEKPKPGFLEKAGSWYFRRLAQRNARPSIAVREIQDSVLSGQLRRTTLYACLWAFLAGAITTVPAVYLQVLHDGDEWLPRILWMLIPTALMTAVEFIVIFIFTMRAVYDVAGATGTGSSDLDRPMFLNPDSMGELLARAALEIPDPVYRFMGIDPMRMVPKTTLLIVGILYKVKIVATNALAKLILTRFLGNTILRMSVAYISVVITGLWNAIVVLRVMRECRLRLSGSLLARYLAEEVLTSERLGKMSETARIGALRVVANAVVLTQNYHPNMLVLLTRLSQVLGIQEAGDYDDWEKLMDTLARVSESEREFLRDLLAVASAFDGRLSSLEKLYLPMAFQDRSEYYFARIQTLTGLMRKGRIQAAVGHTFHDFGSESVASI